MSLLVIDGLCRRYGGVAALDGVGLNVDPGTRTAVVGLSGSGKTTLLRLVVGFEAPDAGRILLGGTTVAGDGVFVPAHRREVGMVAQEGALFPHLSVAGNIGFGLPRRSANRSGEVANLMRLVGLDPVMGDRQPDQLSGGQQQRVALARAMARRPRLMLLDEPFSALDTALRTSTRRAIAAVLERAGIAVLLVTHDQAEAMSFADQVAVLRHGKLAQVGPPAELYAQPADPETAEFLGGALILPAVAGGGWADCALGRVSLRAHACGPITLMLRPEQIDLSPRAEGRGACYAEILDVDYAGPFCTYGARLRSHETPVQFRQTGAVRFSKGEIVGVTVLGQAHTF